MWLKNLLKRSGHTAEIIMNSLNSSLTSFNKEDLINILNSFPVGVMVLNNIGNFIIINNKFTEITGYHYSEMPDIETWFYKAYPDSAYRKIIYEKWNLTKDFLPGETNRDISITCKNGSIKHVVFSSARLNDDSNFITMVDISQLKQAEAKLQKSEEQFKIMFEAAKDPIYVLSKEGRFLQWNQATIDLTGIEKLENEFFYNFISSDYNEKIVTFYYDQFKNNIQLTYNEFPVILKGEETWIGQNTVPYKKDKNGNAESFLVISRNINEQIRLKKELERKNEELEKLSSSDPLTGLYNRRYFNNFFPLIIKNSSRYRKSLAVIFIDLNDFKKANDTYGHIFGDEVLKLFAAILKEAGIRETDIICRYGGDEFVIVLGGLKYGDSKKIVEKRIDDIAQRWDRKKQESKSLRMADELNLSLSIGIRLVDYLDIIRFMNNKDKADKIVDEILKQADTSMYLAKEVYKKSKHKKDNQFKFFEGSF